uniref:acyltransferase family protein n=1 Tax=Enterocloster asparagiformis TaxID=333367 RepID=UPI0036F361D4
MNTMLERNEKVGKNGRLEYMDVAKGIAILAIIIGHISRKPVWVTLFCFSFHVPIFFIISGYFFKQSPWKKLLKSKATHLIGPYIWTCLGVIAISTVPLILSSHSLNIIFRNIVNWLWSAFYGSGNTYDNPFWIKQIGAIWFLLALFFSYVILNLCLRSNKPEVILLFFAWAGWYTAKVVWLPFSVQAGMTSAVFMHIGYKLKQNGKLEELLNQPLKMTGAFLIWFFYLWCGGGRVWMVGNHYEWGIFEIFYTFCASICVLRISLFISDNTSWLKRFLGFLGRNTLYILCFHLIELNTFPWGTVFGRLQKNGLGQISVIYIIIILKLIWAVTGTLMILVLKKWARQRKVLVKNNFTENNLNTERRGGCYNRIEWIDVIRGISILLMVYAHLAINNKLRTIIFSFHMPIFFVLSGYLFSEKKFSMFFGGKVKSLIIPYVITNLLSIIISMWKTGFYGNFSLANILNIGYKRGGAAFWGMSFSSTILQEVLSVGPVWFILALFWSNIIFWIINKIVSKESIRLLVVASISFIGIYIGRRIAFLPHSFDVALVAVGFVYSGYIIRRYDVLKLVSNPIPMFALTIFWLFGIWCGGIELAVRKYPLGIMSLLSSVCGCIVIISILKLFISSTSSANNMLKVLGKNSLIILCIHCLEMQYCNWRNILKGINTQTQFLIRMILILSIMILWFALKETVISRIKIRKLRLQKEMNFGQL